jgi:hypothetical protein
MNDFWMCFLETCFDNLVLKENEFLSKRPKKYIFFLHMTKNPTTLFEHLF